MTIRFIDLFGGIGGFRLGLEKAGLGGRSDSSRNKSSSNGVGIREKPSGRSDSQGSTGLRQDEPESQGGDGHVIGWKRESSWENRLQHNHGFQCVWYCDKDKYAVKIYNKNFGEAHSPSDAREVRSRTIPRFDLLCAGFPCQAFSLAGRRQGFEDTRGTLFFEIARIAKERQPSLLLLENVLGLLSHNEGKTFQTILRTLDEVGYDAEWQVLNSKHFGVPQNRERVYIIGHSRAKPWREIFPLGEILPVTDNPQRKTQGQGQWLHTIDNNYHKGWRNLVHFAFVGEPRIYSEISPTIPTQTGGQHLPFVSQDFDLDRDSNAVDTDGYLRKIGRVRDKNGKPILTPISAKRIRRLTPVECERLQGFPDDWTSGVSDTQRYKTLGNAITVNVVEAIGRRILEVGI